MRTDIIEQARLLGKEKDELVKEIIKLRKQCIGIGNIMEGILYGQRMTERDNNCLRQRLNINSSLFRKLIKAKYLAQHPDAILFDTEKELTHDEMVKKNGGFENNEAY